MKVAVLVYESNEANHIVERLVAVEPSRIVALCVSTAEGSGPRKVLGRLRRQGGWGFVVPKGIEVVLHRVLSRFLPGRFGLAPSVKSIASRWNVPLMEIENVNDESCIAQISRLRPDLLVSVHFDQILREPVLGIPSMGTLNVHGSLLPRNRGLFPYFWALANGEDVTGVTVHWIDPGIDTGNIIAQTPVSIMPRDSVGSVARRCAKAGAKLLIEVIDGIDETGTAPVGVPQDGEGNYVSWPDSESVRSMRRNGHRYGWLLGSFD